MKPGRRPPHIETDRFKTETIRCELNEKYVAGLVHGVQNRIVVSAGASGALSILPAAGSQTEWLFFVFGLPISRVSADVPRTDPDVHRSG